MALTREQKKRILIALLKRKYPNVRKLASLPVPRLVQIETCQCEAGNDDAQGVS